MDDNGSMAAGHHRPGGSFAGERWFASSDGPSNTNELMDNLNNPSQPSLTEAGHGGAIVPDNHMRLQDIKTDTLEDDRALTAADRPALPFNDSQLRGEGRKPSSMTDYQNVVAQKLKDLKIQSEILGPEFDQEFKEEPAPQQHQQNIAQPSAQFALREV